MKLIPLIFACCLSTCMGDAAFARDAKITPVVTDTGTTIAIGFYCETDAKLKQAIDIVEAGGAQPELDKFFGDAANGCVQHVRVAAVFVREHPYRSYMIGEFRVGDKTVYTARRKTDAERLLDG